MGNEKEDPIHSADKVQEFKKLAKPIVDWLRENYHFYGTAIITCDAATVHTSDLGIKFEDTYWLTMKERGPEDDNL